MHDKPLAQYRVALLVANGFMESEMTVVQRLFAGAGASVRTVSPENGLVNSWQGDNWGYNFAIDVPLNRALASDFDVVVVPSGSRSADKLKLTEHTKRFIGGFVAANKPAFMVGDSAQLLSFFGLAQGYEVAAPESLKADIEAAGIQWTANGPVLSGSLMTVTPETTEQLQDALNSFVQNIVEAGATKQAA